MFWKTRKREKKKPKPENSVGYAHQMNHHHVDDTPVYSDSCPSDSGSSGGCE